jgi:hypothetical protein
LRELVTPTEQKDNQQPATCVGGLATFGETACMNVKKKMAATGQCQNAAAAHEYETEQETSVPKRWHSQRRTFGDADFVAT